MSSRDSSTGSGSNPAGYSTVVLQDSPRAYKSDGHRATRTERVSRNGQRSVVINHGARGYVEHAPSPSYGDSKSYAGRK